MDTSNEFVAKRLEAHAAACAGIETDPLVKAAIADRAAAIEIAARWKAPRETVTAAPCSEYHYPGYGPRRQAE